MILPQALGWLAIDIHRRWRSSMLMLDTTAVMARRVVTLQKLSKIDTWSTCLQKISTTWSEEMMNNCGCNSNCSLWTNPATECASKSRQRSAMPASSFINTWGSREDCARSIGEKKCVWLHSFHSSTYRKREPQMRPLWGPLGQSRYVYTLQSIETQQVQCGSVKTYGSIFVVVHEQFFSPGPKQSVWSISICVWWLLCKNLLISRYFHFLISPFVQIEVYHVLCVCFGPAISIDMIISKSRLTSHCFTWGGLGLSRRSTGSSRPCFTGPAIPGFKSALENKNPPLKSLKIL